jgi:Protein of unknown function (DUF1161)
MKLIIGLLGIFLLAVYAPAAVKPCEELKTEIAAKLDAKGAKGYQLEIVATADAKDKTVIGSCDGGTKNIVYTKGGAATQKGAVAADKGAKAPAAAAKK